MAASFSKRFRCAAVSMGWFLTSSLYLTALRSLMTVCLPRRNEPNDEAATSTAEKFVEFLARRRIGETVELALLDDQLGGPHEAAPGGTGERAADADPAHAERRNLVQGEISRPTHEEVHRLRRHAGDHGADVLGCADTRRIEAVGARVRIGFEPVDGVLDIGPPVQETFGAADQQSVAAGLVDGFAGRTNPVD